MELIIVVMEGMTSGIGALLGAVAVVIAIFLLPAGAHTVVDFLATGYWYDRVCALFLAASIVVPAVVITCKVWRELAGDGLWKSMLALTVASGIIGAGLCSCVVWLVALVGAIQGVVTGSLDMLAVLAVGIGGPISAIVLGLPMALFVGPIMAMVVQVLGACHDLVSPGRATIRVFEGLVVLRLLVLVLLWR